MVWEIHSILLCTTNRSVWINVNSFGSSKMTARFFTRQTAQTAGNIEKTVLQFKSFPSQQLHSLTLRNRTFNYELSCLPDLVLILKESCFVSGSDSFINLRKTSTSLSYLLPHVSFSGWTLYLYLLYNGLWNDVTFDWSTFILSL